MISVIFWGSTLLSLLLALLTLLTGNWRFMIASAILYAPLALYLSATPRFAGAFLLYAFHFLMAYSVYRERQLVWLAWVAFVPLALFPLWVALLVINQ